MSLVFFEGGCHCGRVRFRVRAELPGQLVSDGERGPAHEGGPARDGSDASNLRVATDVAYAADGQLEALDCNCSICSMKGFVHFIIAREAFELLAGHDAIATYAFNTGIAKHTFCRVCGVHPFYTPRSHPDGVDVNVRCLDEGAAKYFRVTPFDGRNWEENVETIR